MLSPNGANARLYEEVTRVLNAVCSAVFDDASARGERPDPLLAVPVRLIPFVQNSRSMRHELAACSARCAFLAAALDLASEAIVVLDGHRKVLFANAQARRQAGIAESTAFHLSDPGADRELGRLLTGLDNGPVFDSVPDGVEAVRRIALEHGRASIALVLGAVPARSSPNGAPG